MDFDVTADRRGEIKESENIDKYLNLPRKLSNLWNMQVTEISTVVATLRPGKKPGGTLYLRKNRYHPDYSTYRLEYCEEC